MFIIKKKIPVRLNAVNVDIPNPPEDEEQDHNMFVYEEPDQENGENIDLSNDEDDIECNSDSDDSFFSDGDLELNEDNFLFKIATSIYGSSNLTIQHAEEMMKLLKDISEYTTKLCIEQLSRCSDLNEGIQSLSTKPVLDFDDYLSEHMFKNKLSSLNFYREPIRFTVANEAVEIHPGNLKNVAHQGIIMDIEFQVLKFLEIDGVLENILNYQEHLMNLPNDVFKNFVNGNFWKKVIEKNPGKTLIPVFLYNDDFTIDDNTGPHAKNSSLSAFYYMFPTAPPTLVSKVDMVFNAMTIKTQDIENYGQDSPIYAIMNVFKNMEQLGVTLFQGTPKEKRIHIVLSKILGDNKGMHFLCGFRNSAVLRPCMFCEMISAILKYNSNEVDQDLIRTVEKYDAYFQDGTFLDFGVEGWCLLNYLHRAFTRS